MGRIIGAAPLPPVAMPLPPPHPPPLLKSTPFNPCIDNGVDGAHPKEVFALCVVSFIFLVPVKTPKGLICVIVVDIVLLFLLFIISMI